jgi:hypothetical protein
MANNMPQGTLRDSKPHTLIDKLIIVVLIGLALAGGWSVLGLIFAGLSSLLHVVG